MKIYHAYLYNEKIGEVDAFASEKGELITWWSNNDADWREEYMQPLMTAVGVEVVEAGISLRKKLLKQIMRNA